MTAPSIDTDAELAEIRRLVEHWLFIDQQRLQFTGNGRFAMAFPPYALEGFIKPDGLQPESDAAEVRRVLLARAEGVLEALTEAGWQLTDYPAMEFTGSVTPYMQTLGGELVQPSEQTGVRLSMRFSVDRAR